MRRGTAGMVCICGFLRSIVFTLRGYDVVWTSGAYLFSAANGKRAPKAEGGGGRSKRRVPREDRGCLGRDPGSFLFRMTGEKGDARAMRRGDSRTALATAFLAYDGVLHFTLRHYVGHPLDDPRPARTSAAT